MTQQGNKVKDELKQQTTRLNAVLSAIPDNMFILDSNGTFIDFYATDSEGLKLPGDKIIGSSIFDVFSEEEAKRQLAVYEECIKENALKVIEYELPGNEGVAYHEARIVPLEKNKVLAMVRDITDKKKHEEVLVENEKRFRDLAEMLPEAIFETDLNMFITYSNRKAHKLFGFDENDDYRKINVISAVAPQDREKAKENSIKRMRGIKESYTEYTGLRKDGSTFPMLLQSSVILRDNVPIGFRGVIIDLTQQKEAEDAIKRIEKLESIGILAGGIAHDFNNLLGGLFGTIELAGSELDKGDIPAAKELLNKSISVFSRARDLTLQLLTFSKGGTPSKKAGDISKTVTETVSFVLSGSKVKPVFNFDQELWACEYDSSQIAQTIENMAINSMQSMPEGGKIEFSLKNHVVEESCSLSLEPGKYIKISIKDEGTGIPEKYIKKIFDPFFTTKQTGSGLGLAVSWSVIKKHGGAIDVKSNIGNGTSFYIYLPASSEPLDIESENGEKRETAPVPGRVLVMDDDFIIREVTGKILQEAGFEVVKVESGEKAVKVYKENISNNTPFDIVLLDLTIPGGMGGKETLSELKKINKDVIAIATSGYSEDPVISNPKDFGFFSSIPKPYLKKPFVEIIKEAVLSIK